MGTEEFRLFGIILAALGTIGLAGSLYGFYRLGGQGHRPRGRHR